MLAPGAQPDLLCAKQNYLKNKTYMNKSKDKIIDDCNLAKIIKGTGNHIWLGLTNLVESQRSYSRLEQIWKMVTRTAFEQLNNSIFLLIISILGNDYDLFNAIYKFDKSKFLTS